nr:Uncharacterised protein [Klebsiella pneumoniae]
MQQQAASATLPPRLNSYQRTDYLNDLIFIDLWMNNWSGHYFGGVKFTGFRSQLGVLLPNICQLMPPVVLLTKNKRVTN